MTKSSGFEFALENDMKARLLYRRRAFMSFWRRGRWSANHTARSIPSETSTQSMYRMCYSAPFAGGLNAT